MNRTILVILFLFISLSVSVFSQDTEIDYGGWSEEYASTYGGEETNPYGFDAEEGDPYGTETNYEDPNFYTDPNFNWNDPNLDIDLAKQNWNIIPDDAKTEDAIQKVMEKEDISIDGNLPSSINGDILQIGNSQIDFSQFTGPHTISYEDGDLKIDNKVYKNAHITADGDNIVAEPIEEYYDEQASLTISGGTRMESSPKRVLVEYAESINVLDHTLDKVYYFFYDLGENFNLEEADDVVIEDIHFYNIKNSSFEIAGNQLISANIQARQNQTYELWNPINNSFENIDIIAEKDCRFNLEFRKTSIYNEQQLALRISPCAKVELYTSKSKKLIFSTQAENATLTLTQGMPPAYEIDNGNLSFQTNKYEETLEGVGIAYIDTELGSQEIILRPYLIIQPGGRYTYEDINNKEGSFSLFNHGSVDFSLGLNKEGELYYNTYKQGKDKNWGYIDLPGEFKELNGVITYEKYGTIPITENIQETKFLNVYTKNDLNNIAAFTEENNKIDLFLKNSNPETNDVSQISYGTTTITDTKDRRLLTINQKPKTYFAESYKYEPRPEVIFSEKTTTTANTTIYNTVNSLLQKSSLLSEFENIFSSQIAAVNEQYRAFHLHLTEEE